MDLDLAHLKKADGIDFIRGINLPYREVSDFIRKWLAKDGTCCRFKISEVFLTGGPSVIVSITIPKGSLKTKDSLLKEVEQHLKWRVCQVRKVNINRFRYTLYKYIHKNISYLHLEIIMNYNQLKRPTDHLRDLLFRLTKTASRILNSSGVMISLQGPDGVGKTSVAVLIAKEIKGCFDKTAYFHFRPTLSSDGNLNPVKVSPIVFDNFDFNYQPGIMDKLLSVARIIYNFFYSYIFCYFIKIHRLKINHSFVIFDRYFIDYAVFPESRGFYLPWKIPCFLAALAPQPDLTFYLDCPPEIIRERKKELTPDIIRLHQERTIYAGKYLKNFIIVDASGSIEKVAGAIIPRILDFMNDRFWELRSGIRK